MTLRSKKARAWTPPPVTPLSALGSSEPRRITTRCEPAAEQPKEGDVSDPAYKAWIIATVRHCQAPGCGKPATDPSHHRRKGHGRMAGQKEDRRLIMLCHGCHHGDGGAGFHSHWTFPGMTSEETREHIEAVIRENNIAYMGTL